MAWWPRYAIRSELAELTGRSSVPAVFVGGRCIGGFTDGPGLSTLHAEGKLEDMLRAAKAL